MVLFSATALQLLHRFTANCFLQTERVYPSKLPFAAGVKECDSDPLAAARSQALALTKPHFPVEPKRLGSTKGGFKAE